MKPFISILLAILFLNVNFAQSTLEEGFETWPASNWETYQLGEAIDGWIQDWQGNSHSGMHSAYSSIDNKQSDNWLVSPQVEVANDTYELSFWENSTDTIYYDKASVWISSGSPNPADGDFVEIFESLKNEETWEERIIDLSAYNGQTIAVGFRHEGTWHNWFIDDLKIAPGSYVDGELTAIVNPSGVSSVAGPKDIIVTLRNAGNVAIENADIEWFVNGSSQGTYNGTMLNLQPNVTKIISLGSFDFEFDNAYDIKANLTVSDDFDSSNNVAENMYEVTSARDGLLVGVKPEGMYPNIGIQDVKVSVRNVGSNVIDIAEIEWNVDGVWQTPYASGDVGLMPGQSTELVVGQYDFTTGLHELFVKLNAFGDIEESNDTYVAYVAIDVFWESFEGKVFPPEGWSIEQGVLDDINFDFPVHGEKYYTSVPEWTSFYNISDTLFTPLLDIAQGDKFYFYLKGSSIFSDITTLVWKDGVTGEIHAIQNIPSNTNSWEFKQFDISAAAGVNYIGIINEVAGQGGNGQSKFDLFTSDAKLHVANNDLAITNGEIYFLAKEDESESYTCTIRNLGKNQVSGSDYTLKLMESPGVEIASMQGVTIDSWEETSINILHTFDTLDQHRLYFEIDYPIDENLKNNTFRGTTVSVVPNTIKFNGIGQEGGSYTGLPFNASPNANTLGEDDMSQGLYYSNEFDIEGEIYGVVYNYGNIFVNNTVQHLPLKVWVGQTDTQDLTNGWVPKEELVLVFDGVVEVLPGNNKQMYIPFDIPIQYTGLDNIVIQHYQYDPEYPASLLRFENIQVIDGPLRSLQASDIYILDPENPPGTDYYYLTSNFNHATFIIDPIKQNGRIAGTVYDLDGSPLGNVNVAIDGTSIAVISDAEGAYVLPDLPYGNYDVTASLFGYYNETINVMIDSPTISQDFNLTKRALVDIQGQIVGSNDIEIPLEFVDVNIKGYIEENAVTNSNGGFTFTNVYGDIHEYQLTLFLYGYLEKTITVLVSDLDVDLGMIVLEQEFISPFDVAVEKSDSVVVSWKDPLESEKIKIQYDFGYDSNAYANEPDEEVWLGNIFSIEEITTITSVEIATYYIESYADYVTIDVIDVASNMVIASSDTFLIQSNNIQVIDIPNIVVYDDIAVMVHWQNNQGTTNYLNIDFSDPQIPNTAAIRYPNESIQLLSDYFGNMQNQSFHVRLNTLDDGNLATSTEVMKYNVFRGLSSEFPNIDNWQLLNEMPLVDGTFIDSKLDNIDPNQSYRYAVETTYREGNSQVTFSNVISNLVLSANDEQFVFDQINIYPVPARDFLNISLPSQIKLTAAIKIYDVLGNQIEEIGFLKAQKEIFSIDLTKYTKGVYFLKFEAGNSIYYRNFIVN